MTCADNPAQETHTENKSRQSEGPSGVSAFPAQIVAGQKCRADQHQYKYSYHCPIDDLLARAKLKCLHSLWAIPWTNYLKIDRFPSITGRFDSQWDIGLTGIVSCPR